jgi:hypothetical protein
MIESWRQVWNQRTNGITDPQFPFGFVQVSFIRAYEECCIHTDRLIELINIFIVINKYKQ